MKFNERNFIDFLSRIWKGCWRQSLTLPFVLAAILLTGYTGNAQNIKGVVPVQYPLLGSGVDGDAFAHQPDFTGSLYVNVGDLFDNLHPTIAGHGLINPFTGEVFYKPTITNPPSPQTVPVTYELNDPYINDKTIFTSSNKINDNPKTYTWGAGSSPNKNEIQNCGASFSYGSASVLGGRSDNGTTFVTTGTATGLPGNPLDLWCLFAGDRQVTNGSSYIDFEFLQARLTMTGAILGNPDSLTNIAPITGGSGTFLTDAPDATGGRTVGDILVTIEFTQGGGDATVVIRRWELVSGTYQYKIYPNASFNNQIYCTNNSVDTPVPFDVYGSGFGNGIYAPNQWAEGAINLTQVFRFFDQPCFAISTLFIRTRSSGNSAQSELKDFPGAPIQLDLNFKPDPPIAGPNSRCGAGTVSLSASGCNGTLKWYAAASGGSSIGTGSPFVTPSITTTTSFYVSCTSASGCEGPRTEVVATVNPPATANAGPDQTVCGSSPNVTLAGSVGGGASSGTWSGGTGTFNPNATTLNAVYTPSAAEITAGTVTLTLTTNDPTGPCLAVSDTMTITINPAATANAGADQTVCSSSPNVTLAGSVGGGASSGTWSGGTGTFNPNATTLTAVYTPSAAEITAGTLTLTLTTNDPAGICPAVSDTMTITINPAATANAGADQTVCSSSPNVTLAGSVGGGASSGTWSGGTGTFNPNATTLTAVYTPSAAEITAGTVTLTLTTNDPTGPCPAVSDTMTITINPAATANAGADQTVCASSPNVTLAGSVGGGASSGTWSGGTGTFNPNASTLTAVYTPSAAEIAAGTVTLTLTTNDPTGPCPAVSDTMTITINTGASANAGPDQTVCASSPNVTLAGSVGGGASSGTWSGGTGTFNPNASTLTAVYTPSAAEITAGTVTLTLTSNDPEGPCTAGSDTMTITINPAATANAGADKTVCASSPNVTLAGSVGGGASSGTWSGGTGTFNPNASTLTAVYTPSAAEITAGTVTLTLTTNDPAGPCPAVSDTMTITINPNPACSITGGQTVCTGVSSTFTATAGMASYLWTGPGGFTASTPSITVSVAGIYEVTITNSNGCSSKCSRELIVQGCGKACTPGFWKNHPEVWDTQNDFVVNNMPGVLTNPVTPGGTFVASTSFYAYFNIAKTSSISNKADLTMLGATQLSGGDCKALARHGVAALLGAAAFPGEYPFPAGSTDFASLYTLIRNAFLSGDCSALAATLGAINDLDGPFCSALSQLAQVAALENTALTSKTAAVGFEAYPVPFKDQLTIKYKFDYVSDVKIDVFNAQGVSILSKADTNSYLNKEITLNLNAKKGQEQVYVVKVTTDRGSSSKKVISSK